MSLPNACPKPPPRVKVPRKGITAQLRAKKARVTVLAERLAKSLVRDRDRRCRWPGCNCSKIQTGHGPDWSALEVAHTVSKGAGGDPKGIRTQVYLMVLLCRWRHRGPFGLHAGRAKVLPLTDRGTDGPCEFRYQHLNGKWTSAGVTSPPKELSGNAG